MATVRGGASEYFASGRPPRAPHEQTQSNFCRRQVAVCARRCEDSLSFCALRYFLTFSFLGKKKEKVAKKKFNANESSIKNHLCFYVGKIHLCRNSFSLLSCFLLSEERRKCKKVTKEQKEENSSPLLPACGVFERSSKPLSLRQRLGHFDSEVGNCPDLYREAFRDRLALSML